MYGLFMPRRTREKRGRKRRIHTTNVTSRSFGRSFATTMSTPTKENDDGMTTGTNTAVAVAAVDVVASTRVKTPSSVRRATAVDVVFKLNV
jgi:hypothetical protein